MNNISTTSINDTSTVDTDNFIIKIKGKEIKVYRKGMMFRKLIFEDDGND